MMDLKVLIVEDDELSIKHLQFLFKRLGIHNIKFCNFKNFKFMISMEHFHIIMIDILLENGMSGLDLIQHIDTKQDSFVWVMSGVIKKDNISRNSLPRIHSFFKKPINGEEIEEALQKIKGKISDVFFTEGILDSFLMSSYSRENLQTFVQNNSFVQGHELVTLLYLFSDSRWTGRVKLKANLKEYNTILMFSNGDLISVQTLDQKSFFGVLAKAHGFVTDKIIKNLIAKGGDKPIGYKLVHAGHLSPHSLHFILEEQSKIRLSQLMGSHQNYTVKLIPEDIKTLSDDAVISFQKNSSFLLEILWGKVDLKWLEDFFSDKNSHVLKFNNKKIDGVSQQKWQNNFERIIKCVDNKKTILEIRKELSSQMDLQELLFSFYYLLVSKTLSYQRDGLSEQSKVDLKMKVARFKKHIEHNNYFNLLGLQKNASFSEIKNQINHVVKVFHPDQYIEPDIKKMCNEILFHLNQMRDTLLDEEKKNKYIFMEAQKGKVDLIQLLSEYNKGKKELEGSRNNFAEALQIFEPIKDEESLPEDVKLYYLWAFIKSKDIREVKIRPILRILDQISVEMKFTELYFYIKALCYLIQYEKDLAQEYLKKSLAVNENFFPARIELHQLKKDRKSPFKKFFNAS